MDNDAKQGIMLINRDTGKIQKETVFGNGALRFMYETLLGRTFWGIAFNSANLSDWLGRRYDSPKSKKKIPALASTPGCNPEEAEFPPEQYENFNAFFTRKLKPEARPCDQSPEILSSPSDGRVFVYENLKPTDPVPVKGAMRSLENLCQMPLQEKSYSVAVIRLAPVDYHRYHFPCACKNAGTPFKIKGKYHSVNPIAFSKAPDLFVENTKVVTPLFSPVFGKFFFLEVGAFGVGSIVNTAVAGKHEKLDEKGFFKFGGSTVILVMDAEKIKFDPDLIRNSANKVEMLVRCGEKIGIAK